MKISNDKATELKKDFPIFESNKGLAYLDNSATTQKPYSVIKKVAEFYKNYNSNIHRAIYALGEDATRLYEDSRKETAKFINCKPEELIFTKGTTESINLLAYTLPFITKKKKIVTTYMEHHSNFVPWQQLAKKQGFNLELIDLKGTLLDYDDAYNKIDNKTAIVSISHVSNVLGTKNDVKRIIKIAKEVGAITIIDGAQSVPNSEIDFKSLGCDFLAFSSHKMLGPTGLGFLCGKKEILEKLPPFNFGGDMIKNVELKQSEWNGLPWKFEAGTPNIAGAIAFSEAVSYLNKIGMKNIEDWEKKLFSYAFDKIKERGIKIYSNGDSGILSFNVDGVHAHDVSSVLNDFKVCIRAGHHCAMPLMKKMGIDATARASFYFYNNYHDIDMLIKGLKEVKRIFAK